MNHNLVKPRSARNTSKRINPAHFSEWVDGSGVDPEITHLSLTSLNDRTVVAARINWKKYPDCNPLGWFASGLNLATMKPQPFGQFKPDEPIKLRAEDEKPAKYITRKGGGQYDAIALPHPDKGFWQRVLDDVSIIVDLDEGTKKSGAGMTCGFPSLALCGVTMWQIKGELVPNLAAVAVPGRIIRIRFDMDVLFKKEVQLELKKLVKALEQRGCIVLIAMWNPELGLKIDDVKVNHGPEMVAKIMADAIPYSQWLKNLEAQISSTGEARDTRTATVKKPPTPQEIAAQLAEEYQPQWKYHEAQQTWRGFTGKSWEKIGVGEFKSLIVRTLDAKGIKYSGIEYVNNVIEMLKCYLREVNWQTWDKSRYVNFENCVLDGDTLETLPHSSGMMFTSHLPYPYQPLTGDLSAPLEALKANCPNINQFFQTAMQGDVRKIFKLLAIVNSCLRFSFHGYQQFVHFIGVPGSGKGTCARLFEKIVGKNNTQPCSLDSLKDGSTIASIIDKQLVVFGDERKPVGVESILRLTGGDSVNYREVYQPAASAYFYGLMLICSNDPIFMGNTTGLDRRLCLVNFENAIPKHLRNSEMEASFDGEIASLIAIALSLPSSEVKQAIQGIGNAEIADFKAAEWEMKVRMDSLAAFFEMELIVEDGASIRAGECYSQYKAFCEEIKKPAMSLTTFSPGLGRLCTELHQPVTRDTSGRHVTFIGLRMRGKDDEHPTYSQQLAENCRTSDSTCRTSAGLVAGLPPIQDIALQDLQDLSPNILEECEIAQKEIGAAWEKVDIKEVTPPSPASPAKPICSKAASPAQSPATPPPSPATIGEGDRVEITLKSDYQGQKGVVTNIGYGSTEITYYVQLENEKVILPVPMGALQFAYLRKL